MRRDAVPRGLSAIFTIIILFSVGACGEKEERKTPALPSTSLEQAAKPHIPSSISQGRPASTFKGYSFKGYSFKVEDAEKRGKVLIVKARIGNDSSKKTFKKMVVVLKQYDRGMKLLSTSKKIVDISSLSRGSSRDETITFGNPHPRVQDIEMSISGIR